jgi:hypothetical protein
MDSEPVQQWDVFELSLTGPAAGNPFTEVQLSAQFRQGDRVFAPEGFYDGDGVYRVRFMPDATGGWTFVTKSNRPELDGKTGGFLCTQPAAGNHGPVRVRNTWYLAYADGTPHFQVGTTCYAWAHQGDAREEQTLNTLAAAPFNKLRMCVFPKSYSYNQNEPELYAYEGKPLTDWDFTRFNPAFWQHFEKRVGQLRDLGIEADLILFHPYDRWGFATMSKEQDEHYLRYCVARLAAYRNVWWSFANEFDLMAPGTRNHRGNKEMADWDRFFQVVQAADPYNHLRGIHNCREFYDHTKPWVTHCSIQSSDFDHMRDWREQYRKPVLYDECKYEGNIPQGWGNIDAREMTRRFWLGTMGGCYVGHGETYKHPEDILWWAKGGVLHGESPARIAFLKKVMTEAPPFEDLVPQPDPVSGVKLLAKTGAYHLVYFDQGMSATVELPGEVAYKADGLDTWEMTTESLGSVEAGPFSFTAPNRGYLLRLTPYAAGERRRPEVKVVCDRAEGVPPLSVKFDGNGGGRLHWDFGDGTESDETTPTHVYAEPGLYRAKLTVTDEAGLSSCSFVAIAVDHAIDEPLVRVGFADGDRPEVKLNGQIGRGEDGSFELGTSEPWRWVTVGEAPLEMLEGLRSFTILGWAKPSSLTIGSGGNRIAFNLQYNHAGFDLVHHADGRLRLAVNEWPDRADNDSSPGKLRPGEWTFLAVTYDATRDTDNVRWYFGGAETPANLDRTTSYNRGPTGTGAGPLTIGNYNETIHRHGTDRQFRGALRGFQVFGSRISSRGALSLERIRQVQAVR